ncbi:MAG TPA: LCP family protein [Actinomycetota bacterium]|nr:LCP family protein [Actinomycetota bacterium]
MTRRPWVFALVGVLALVATSVLVAMRDRPSASVRPAAPAVSGLTLLVVEGETAPLGAVVGTTGFGGTGVLVLPQQATVTIPGQGESTVAEALELPPEQAATAVSNLLGVWIDHAATTDAARLAALVDRVGGVQIGGETVSGQDAIASFGEPGAGGARALAVALEAIAGSGATWTGEDLSQADERRVVLRTLNSAAGARVTVLPAEEVATGLFQSAPETVTAGLVQAFGGPVEEAVPVIVLNGNGAPGVGEMVAEKILPGGFRIVVSDNASTFDHAETLVVVGSSNDVDLAERVRDLLGIGSVSVSVGSGIAPVTIVVGKDFIG